MSKIKKSSKLFPVTFTVMRNKFKFTHLRKNLWQILQITQKRKKITMIVLAVLCEMPTIHR